MTDTFIFCTKCGQQNEIASNFCQRCGQPLKKNIVPIQPSPKQTPSNVQINDSDDGILSNAAKQGRINDIRIYVKNRKYVQSHKNDMQRALVLAAARNYTDIGELLIVNGADVNYQAVISFCRNDYRNNIYRSPIFNAVECANFEFIDLLIRHGANLNVFNENGDTPLVAACYSKEYRVSNISNFQQKIIDMLLAAGADPYLGWKDKEGTSFSDVYKGNKYKPWFDPDNFHLNG